MELGPRDMSPERLEFIAKVYGLLGTMLSATFIIVYFFLIPRITPRRYPWTFSLLPPLRRREMSKELQTAADEDGVCRICQEKGQKDDLGVFCECRGSLALCHQTCLEKWRFASRACDHCEICLAAYSVEDDSNQLLLLLRRVRTWLAQQDNQSTIHRFFLYGATAACVWAWLWTSRECDGKTPKLSEMLSSCTSDASFSGWLRATVGAAGIGLLVRGVTFWLHLLR
ncbi:unnamed protein product [Cladocopium goreaui]|uniref:E3 ubiquitin-protein ligase MARCHF3 (Membrane-associated RING finger protein 3) (Membrane-associated RING-CH protein III) (MARCH-III) (RING-type E3 ubiquitin transferase MARCHF3) n=1 Tax=Cladocopium goreaui TaxID=2562237 RepID=A0A9P1GQG3_9DINO|nr:unnamed protein product [Cladocopium goreaui]